MTRNSDGTINWKFIVGVLISIVGFAVSTGTTMLLGKLDKLTNDVNRLSVTVARIATTLKIPVDQLGVRGVPHGMWGTDVAALKPPANGG